MITVSASIVVQNQMMMHSMVRLPRGLLNGVLRGTVAAAQRALHCRAVPSVSAVRGLSAAGRGQRQPRRHPEEASASAALWLQRRAASSTGSAGAPAAGAHSFIEVAREHGAAALVGTTLPHRGGFDAPFGTLQVRSLDDDGVAVAELTVKPEHCNAFGTLVRAVTEFSAAPTP